MSLLREKAQQLRLDQQIKIRQAKEKHLRINQLSACQTNLQRVEHLVKSKLSEDDRFQKLTQDEAIIMHKLTNTKKKEFLQNAKISEIQSNKQTSNTKVDQEDLPYLQTSQMQQSKTASAVAAAMSEYNQQPITQNMMQFQKQKHPLSLNQLSSIISQKSKQENKLMKAKSQRSLKYGCMEGIAKVYSPRMMLILQKGKFLQNDTTPRRLDPTQLPESINDHSSEFMQTPASLYLPELPIQIQSRQDRIAILYTDRVMKPIKFIDNKSTQQLSQKMTFKVKQSTERKQNKSALQ